MGDGVINDTREVVGRLAPTPSGRMHLGNALSALVAWLSARSSGGSMVLRIEDLDPRARDPEAASLIMGDLAWLGLDWDEGPYFQSERGDLYTARAEVLIAMDEHAAARADIGKAAALGVPQGTLQPLLKKLK